MELLVILKAVKKTDVREDNLDVDVMTEEMAEMGSNEQTGDDNCRNDDAILEEQAREGEEIDGSVFVRVSCCYVFTTCHN
jgi:hypothetical protein